ncbi:FAD-dependent oxidoreductase [Komagataeibacter melomenusus]
MSKQIRFLFEGQTVTARTGQSVTAALLQHGEMAHRITTDGTPRGPLCGIGACNECLLQIDGRIAQRGCMTTVTQGMDVRRLPARPDLTQAAPLAACPDEPIPTTTCDVLVIGSGPAGIAAATALAQGDVRVIVTDERHMAGGQFFKQDGLGSAPCDEQQRRGQQALAAMQEAGAQCWTDTLIWGAFREKDGLTIGALRNGEALYIRPRFVVIATGAQERPAPIPGWTLPGVITTGACQTLMRANDSLPGQNILITGNGPLNLQVAREILRRGGHVAALVEAAAAPFRRPAEAARLATLNPRLALTGLSQITTLRRNRVPVLWSNRLVRIEGQDRVEAAIVVDARGHETRIATDTVCIGDGFVPANELPRLLGCVHDFRATPMPHLTVRRDGNGATSQADTFVIGEAGGFGGADIAWGQGHLSAQAILHLMGRPVASTTPWARKTTRARAFQKALWQLYAAPPPPSPATLPDDQIICRCENITLGTLRARIEQDGITDPATLKRATRCGMGRCQGRFCGASVASLTGHITTEKECVAPQMPVRPVPLAALAREKPEWKGHRRTVLPTDRPAAIRATPAQTADAVVVGAGVVGAFTALFLAQSGLRVTLLDRGHPGAMASGGNAGSLHAQLLSFDYGAPTQGLSPAARTMPLQKASIALWESLRDTFDRDIEMKRTGGLMIAQSEADLERMRQKVTVEQSIGVNCSLVGADELRRLEPALTPQCLGGAWCPDEGKINPLSATLAVLSAARRHGVQIVPMADVRAITRTGNGYTVGTTAGTWSAATVVNAAGSFAARIGQLLGLDVPVHGAPLQMIVTEPVAPMLHNLIAHASRHLTVKQAVNGSILIGGGWTAGLDPVHAHPRPQRDSLEGNLWVARSLLPGLDRLHIIRSWAAMNIDIDGAPILGEHPDCPNFYNAVTSNGYTLAPMMGRITADLIVNRSTLTDISPFTMARFADRTP